MPVGNDKGYTLLELLVAVAIMAIAAVPLAQSLSSGLGVWDRLHREASDAEAILLVRSQLAAWLGRSYPADPLRSRTEINYPFQGNHDRVSFISAIGPDTRNDAVYAIAIELSPEGHLTATIHPDHIEPDTPSDETITMSAVLLDKVSRFELAYFQKHALGGVWLDSWQDQLAPPKAVRVRLTAQDDAFVWPDLIVPITVEEWAHCAFDAVTQTCFSGGAAG